MIPGIPRGRRDGEYGRERGSRHCYSLNQALSQMPHPSGHGMPGKSRGTRGEERPGGSGGHGGVLLQLGSQEPVIKFSRILQAR